MQKPRPVNLNLTSIRFPITAISSILHRISGVILFLMIVFLLYALKYSLLSQAGFTNLSLCLHTLPMRFLTWVFLSALSFHAIAGIRHLLMDLGMGETKVGGRMGAYIVIVLSIIVIIALGVRLW